MRQLLLVIKQIKKINSESGFNLLELLLVTVIMGIATAVAVPNLVESRQDNEAKEVFTKINGALIQAQAEANRVSRNCGIEITSTQLENLYPNRCRIDTFNIDSDVVSVTSSGDMSEITYSLRGTTNDGQTIWITRKKNDEPYMEVSRCIVISGIGMIRTGVYDDGKCNNTENDRYDSSI